MLHDLWQGHFRPTRKRNIALRTDEEEEQSTAASRTAVKHPSTYRIEARKHCPAVEWFMGLAASS
jgi:hypothetical protein